MNEVTKVTAEEEMRWRGWLSDVLRREHTHEDVAKVVVQIGEAAKRAALSSQEAHLTMEYCASLCDETATGFASELHEAYDNGCRDCAKKIRYSLPNVVADSSPKETLPSMKDGERLGREPLDLSQCIARLTRWRDANVAALRHLGPGASRDVDDEDTALLTDAIALLELTGTDAENEGPKVTAGLSPEGTTP